MAVKTMGRHETVRLVVAAAVWWAATTAAPDLAAESRLAVTEEAAHRRLIRAIELDNDERVWIAAHPRVRAYFEPWPPFLLEQDGREAGITVDYLELICGELDLELEWVHLEWSAALEAVQERRDVDVLPLLTHRRDRETFLEFTREYVSFPIVIFTRQQAQFVGGLDDLAGRWIAVERNYAMHDRLSTQHPDQPLLVVGTTEEALEAVATARAEAYLGNLAVASYLIQRQGLNNLVVAAPSPFGTHDQAIGVRSDWITLARLLDRGLAAVTDEGHASIRQRWLAVRVEPRISQTGTGQLVALGAGAGVFFLVFGFWIWRLRREIRTRQAYEVEVHAGRAELQRRHADIDDLVASIDQSLDELINVSEELHGVAQHIDRGATTQASAVTEVQHTIGALAASSGAIAEATSSVSRHAEGTLENHHTIATTTEALVGHARHIEQLLEVIHDVADKSDLLALNAALEAARAGEAGRSFAMVADQLQRLAEHTVSAVDDIGEHVEAVRLGSATSMKSTADGLDRAKSTSTAAHQIEQTAHHQQSGTEQAARAINEIGGVAEGTALRSAHLVELAATLADLSHPLLKVIERNRPSVREGVRLAQPTE